MSGTPKLSEVARIVHAPARITTTGWPAVEAKCADLGIVFRWWQVALGRLILAKREDGMYASTIGGTGASIPRQVGKTFLVAGIMFALCLLRPGFTVLWTAHRLKTAEETFGKLQVFARRRKIAPFVKQVFTGSGEQQIVFHNGSRILFGARERGFGRGFDEVDALVFDEAQILTDSALDDMVPATNQSRQPEGVLMLFVGTPPRPQDPGEVFTRMRNDALAGDEDTGWVEFGADPDFRPTPLPAPLSDADWGQIATANPSFPEDTSRTAILRMRKKLGDDSFLREGAGIWGLGVGATSSLDIDAWGSLADPSAERGRPVFGVDVDADRRVWIGTAWRRPDGLVQVELVPTEGVTPLTLGDRVARLREKFSAPVGCGGTTGDLTGGTVVKTSEFAAACGTFTDLLEERQIRHGNHPDLNGAVAAAKPINYGTAGAKQWQLRDVEGIGPLAAVTRALAVLASTPASVYEERGALVF
jgi:hypothetical protein